MEKSFEKPQNLNGATLIAQLIEAGVKIKKDYRGNYEVPRLDGEGVLWIDISESQYEIAKAVVAAHNA